MVTFSSPLWLTQKPSSISDLWSVQSGHQTWYQRSINCISQHRDDVKCRSAFKVSKLDSKSEIWWSDADPKVLGSVGENPCGFCGQGSCFTQLKVKKSGGFSIVSNCPYHYSGMQYKKAADFSKTLPWTNVPIHCPLCPTAVSGDPPTIWKYNALYHLISEHSSGSTPPPIPGQLLVQIFVTKEEEKALGISRTYHSWLEEAEPIFLIVMGLNWDRQEKDLTQFQQFILIVMIKKGTNWRRYKSRYYYKSM